MFIFDTLLSETLVKFPVLSERDRFDLCTLLSGLLVKLYSSVGEVFVCCKFIIVRRTVQRTV